jgi:HSF-type DNA-binding
MYASIPLRHVFAHVCLLPVLDFLSSKMMLMLMYVDRMLAKEGKRVDTAAISWTPSGHAFVIRDKDKVVSDLLPLFAGRGKFSSFTRKLYRWGFRQVNTPTREEAGATAGAAGQPPQECRELVFANENFQRDSKSLLPRMKSTTAASIRRQQAAAESFPGRGTTNQESKDGGQRLSDFQRKLTEGQQHQQQQGRSISSLAMLSAPIPGIAASSSSLIPQRVPAGPSLVGLVHDTFSPTLVDLVNALHHSRNRPNPSNEILQQALNELNRQRQLSAAIASLQNFSAPLAPPPPQVRSPPRPLNDEFLTSLLTAAAVASSTGRAAAARSQQQQQQLALFNQAPAPSVAPNAAASHLSIRSSEIDELSRLAVDLYLRNAAGAALSSSWPPHPSQGPNKHHQQPPPPPPPPY